MCDSKASVNLSSYLFSVMPWMQVLGIGRLLNLSMQLDRIELTLSLVRAYFLMVVMARSVPELGERLTLYDEIARGHGGRRYAETSLLAYNAVSSMPSSCLEEPTAAKCLHSTCLCKLLLWAW